MKRLSVSSSISAKAHRTDTFSIASSEGNDAASPELEKDDCKRKSRNLSEKKRRDQFNMLINELCSMVNGETSAEVYDVVTPASAANRKMNKTSVLRSAISFLRDHSETNGGAFDGQVAKACEQRGQPNEPQLERQLSDNWKPSSLSHEEFSQLMLEALDAFVLVIEADEGGNIVYGSESILPLLGHNPTSFCGHKQHANDGLLMAGVSIFDLVHESDKSSLQKLLSGNISDPLLDPYLSILLHFKERNLYPEGNAYQLVRLLGSFVTINETQPEGEGLNCFVAVGRLQTPKLLRELRMVTPFPFIGDPMSKNNEFISRHSLEWKFLFLDHRGTALIGYMPFEVLGTSGYDYYHWDDLDIVVAGHIELMKKGEGTSVPYRFLTKGQQWLWLQTRYYITYHQWNSKPEFIVCTHTITGCSDDADTPRAVREDDIGTSRVPDENMGAQEAGQIRFNANDSPSSDISSSTLATSSFSTSSTSNSKLSPSMSRSESRSSLSASVSYTNTSSGVVSDISQSLYSATQSVSYTSLTSTKEPKAADLLELKRISFQSLTNSSSEQKKDHSVGSAQNLTESSDSCHPIAVAVHSPQTETLAFSQIKPQVAGQTSLGSVQPQDQSHLHEFLRQKHQMLQKQILHQQEELRRVSEQLMMVQFVGNIGINPEAAESELQPNAEQQQQEHQSSDGDNELVCPHLLSAQQEPQSFPLQYRM